MIKVNNTRGMGSLIGRFRNNRDGNIALTFGIVAIPLMLVVGASVDYVRAYNVRDKMQSDLDAGLLAAIQQVDSLDEDEIEDKIAKWFEAQTDLTATRYSIDDIEVNKKDGTVSASVSASVPTTFMNIANISEIPVQVYSAGKGPTTAFLEVYVVLDKSASMLLPSTQADRTKLYNLVYNYSYSDSSGKNRAYTKCEFACHSGDGQYFKYGTSTYTNIYDLMKSYESSSGDTITLRTDTALTAVQKLIDMVDDANTSTSHIKMGLYSFGETLVEAVAPTASISKLEKALTDDSLYLTSSTSQSVSYFNDMADELEKEVGTAGDGSSSAKPMKLILLLTDGVQSSRPWVISGVNWTWGYYMSNTVKTPKSGSYWDYVAPMNPAWCDDLKDSDITIGVLNTEYLAIDYDWGYLVTLGDTMANTNWKSIWGGTMRSDISSSTVKRDYLQYALEDCASSSSLFISASDEDEIEEGLSSLFDQYMNTVRLTQ